MEEEACKLLADKTIKLHKKLVITKPKKKVEDLLRFFGVKKTKFESADFYTSSNGAVEGNKLQKTKGGSGWNSLIKLNAELKEGRHIFKLKILKLNGDK